MHRSIFESLMRTLKGHLLYQAEYLSRLLVKPPPGRSEADVLKLASYLTSLQRFQEVPQPKLVQLAKEVTYAELAVGTVICRQGDDGDCMYIILRGSCNVHVDPDFDETAQAGALQKASLQPKVLKKKQPAGAGLTAKHLLRPGTGHLERLSSSASIRSDTSAVSSVTATSRRSTESHDGNPRRLLGTGEGSVMSKGRAIATAMAGAIDGESPKLTDDQVVLLEQQYGPLDRNLPTGGSFGELSLADTKLARRNATIIAAEPASLIRIDKQLYRKTLYEMQLTATAEKLAFLRQVPIFEGSNSRQLTQLHFVLEKCTVQRGHIIILEGQPCAGMFFIVNGQVIMLARATASAAAPEADGDDESMPDEAADMPATRWGGGATMSWWGPNGRDGEAAAGRLPGVTGRFQQVAILGPAEFIGEVIASKHKFTAVAECECDLLWLKPQELHMLGSKSLGLAVQYSALRETRWQQHQKAASLLLRLHSVPTVKQGTSASSGSGKRRAARKRPASAAVSNMAATASSPADVSAECVALPAAHWSERHHHRHTVQHPHVKPDLMSSLHFSRPRSALHTTVHHQAHTAAEICDPANMEAYGSHAEAAIAQSRSSAAARQTAGALGQIKTSAGDGGDGGKTRSCASSTATAAGCGMQGHIEPDKQESLVAPEDLLQDAQPAQVMLCEECIPEASKGGLGEALENRQPSDGVAADQQQPYETNCGMFSEDTISRKQADKQEPEEEQSSERQAGWRHRKSGRQSGQQERQRNRLKGRQQCSQPEHVGYSSAGVYRLRPGVMHLPTAKEGVMGRMQCLQSAVSKPAHWSIASTQLHTRPKAEAFRLKVCYLHILEKQ
ncbi:TPA: hypothetical protein ACH3X1_007456 [Trebouxia sp. C0004]